MREGDGGHRSVTEEALRRSEEMLRLVLDTIPQFIFWKDRDSVFLGCNQNFARVAGVSSPEEIIGKTDFDLAWRRGESEFFREVDRRVMASDTAQLHIIEPQRQAGGRHAWLDTSKVPLHDATGRVVGILGAFEDITDRMRHEREQRAIVTVAKALRGAAGRDELVSLMLDQVLDLIDADGVALAAPDAISGNLVIELAKGSWKDVIGGHVFVGDGLTRHLIESGEPYLNNHVADDSRLACPEILDVTASIAGVPLVAEGETLAVLWIGRNRSISQDDVQMLSAVANMTGSALRRISHHDRLQRMNLDLIEAYDVTLEGWARALELRDSGTEGHTRRVAELSMRLGTALGLTDDALVDLRRGALLHDIGKMAVPDRILLKPEALDVDEWRIMRRHPEYARDMLSHISFLSDAIVVPYCHHERWDGSGYPQGLRGESIPLAARVFAVVDVWDALRANRPYRDPWPAEKAINYISGNSGILFDPRVVAAFLELVGVEVSS